MMTESNTEQATLGRLKSRRIMRHAQGGAGLAGNRTGALSLGRALSRLPFPHARLLSLHSPSRPAGSKLTGGALAASGGWSCLPRPRSARLNLPVATSSGNAFAILDVMFYVSNRQRWRRCASASTRTCAAPRNAALHCLHSLAGHLQP